MKRYISGFRKYFHRNKELDTEHYGYNCEDVEEAFSDIEDEVSEIKSELSKGNIGIVYQKLDELYEKL